MTHDRVSSDGVEAQGKLGPGDTMATIRQLRDRKFRTIVEGDCATDKLPLRQWSRLALIRLIREFEAECKRLREELGVQS